MHFMGTSMHTKNMHPLTMTEMSKIILFLWYYFLTKMVLLVYSREKKHYFWCPIDFAIQQSEGNVQV